MARKAKKRELEDQWRFYLLHRECVRRNPDYKPDYDKRKDEDMFASKWGLIDWVDPNDHLPAENILTEKKPPDMGNPEEYSFDPYEMAAMHYLDRKHHFALPHDDSPALDSILVMTYFHKGKAQTAWRHLENMRRPKGKIMRSIEELVDYILEDRKKAGLNQDYARKKIRLEECVNSLKAYDLRIAGKTFPEIAKTMWPGARGNTEKKARRYYENGQRLVMKPPFI